MPALNLDNLRHYRNLGYNVLLESEAGVGKTATIVEVFSGLKWKYFSAPTLDPWVDFVGVPRPVRDEKLQCDVMDLIRPRFIVENQIEAIFIDELNRAPSKVLDAVMELIQFRSINGQKLTNLKMIWAAINPEDENGDYTVSKLDKALRDRFHVQILVPYKLNEEYFTEKYPDIGPAFCAWWNSQNDQVKKKISPRRLDYMADAHLNGCSLSDFVPDGVNVRSLISSLKQGDFHAQLNAITTAAEAKRFLSEPNNATKLLQLINKGDRVAAAFYKRFGSVIPKEIVEALAPQVTAIDRGAEMTSLAVLLPTLKAAVGSLQLTKQINEAAFVYPNGGSLLDEVKRELNGTAANVTAGMKKLGNHIFDVLGRGTRQELEFAMYNDGAKMTQPSNLFKIAMYIGQEDRMNKVWEKNKRKKISDHTYKMDVVGQKWMS